MEFSGFDIPRLLRNRKEILWLSVASRPDGGVWRLPCLSVTGAAGGPALLVIAGVHGDEYEGIEAIPRVFKQVRPEDLRGTLVMLPVCNMPAYEAATRSSPVDGLNLARVFPGEPEGSITQRIAFWITEKLIRHADFLIDLHSGGLIYNLPTLAGYLHTPDEMGRRAREAALAFGAPVLWGHPPPVPPGRSLSAATDLGVPALYTEAPGGGLARPEDVACFCSGVLNVMKWMEMLSGDPRAPAPRHDLVGQGNLDRVISAPAAGYFRPDVSLLDDVTAGQRLGAVYDFLGDPVAELAAPADGVVVMLRRLHKVAVGDGLVQLARRLV